MIVSHGALDRLHVAGDSLAGSAATPRPTATAPHHQSGEIVSTHGRAFATYQPQPVKTWPKRQAPIVRHRRPGRGKRKLGIGAWMRGALASIAAHWPWS